MRVIPISLKQANDFVESNHRHHGKAQGCKFCIAVVDEKEAVRGVAIVGRPVSRYEDNGATAEVTRMCTDGYRNACSFLYGSCAKIARAVGYQKIITYTLAEETGISLKAAAWICKGICGGGNWNAKGRPRTDSRVPGKKKQYYKLLQGG